jgi:hypothetical protein
MATAAHGQQPPGPQPPGPQQLQVAQQHPNHRNLQQNLTGVAAEIREPVWAMFQQLKAQLAEISHRISKIQATCAGIQLYLRVLTLA